MSKKKKYKSSSHAKYLLKAYIIFVIKCRKKVLVNAVEDAMKQILFDIANASSHTNHHIPKECGGFTSPMIKNTFISNR